MNAARDSYALEHRAALECTVADAAYALIERYALQSGAFIEGVVADGCRTTLYVNFFERLRDRKGIVRGATASGAGNNIMITARRGGACGIAEDNAEVRLIAACRGARSDKRHGYRRKRGAISECIGGNAYNALGNNDITEGGASVEGI